MTRANKPKSNIETSKSKADAAKWLIDLAMHNQADSVPGKLISAIGRRALANQFNFQIGRLNNKNYVTITPVNEEYQLTSSPDADALVDRVAGGYKRKKVADINRPAAGESVETIAKKLWNMGFQFNAAEQEKEYSKFNRRIAKALKL